MNRTLSKSQFLRGLQCHKSLWLHRYKPELRAEPDESQQAAFDVGKVVGILARELFPGGTAVEFEGTSLEEKIRLTRELIEGGAKTIYEATFSYDDVLVMVDILRKGRKGWEIYEVKSSTEVKDVHVSDVAVQYYVLAGSGLNLSKAALVYLNNKYVRQGDLDVNELFTVSDLTDVVTENQGVVKKGLKKMRSLLKGDSPEIDIGLHCSTPYECDFTAHCWEHIPECSVFDLSRLRTDKKFELYYNGVIRFKDIPNDYPLNSGQKMQVDAHLTGMVFIDKKEIREFLDTLGYPLYFLDFETFQPAIPMFEGTSPYEKIPFQYSLHYLEREGGKLKHTEFLGKEGTDLMEELVKRLTSDIPSKACVLTYNMAFEKGVIKGLAERFPAYSKKLMNIHDNIRDLMTPFQKKHWYTKEMRGSYSIKYVLPALVPDLGYEGMDISNGDEAMSAYSTLHLIKDRKEVARIRKALLEYCRLDTYGMVKLLERLREVASRS